MTSNIGSHYLTSPFPNKRNKMNDSGGHQSLFQQQKTMVLQELKRSVRPELLNRLDDIVVFQPLDRIALRKVVQLQFQSVHHRLAENNITMDVTVEALDLILNESYDPEYGARPIKRYIEKHIVTKLSVLIISGQIAPQSRILVTADSNNQLDFKVQPNASSMDIG